MMQIRRIVFLASLVVAALLLPRAAAQNYVTPIVKPTPPGQLIPVNNIPGANHLVPRIDGDLVCYDNDASPTLQTVRYFNLVTGTDNAVPAAFDGSQDFLCDVRGTIIVFTRDGAEASILTFDTASSTLTEIDPTPGSQRFEGQIGDQTIAWQDSSLISPASWITAWDRASNTATMISPTSAPPINEIPGISPDGGIVVWESCVAIQNCLIWKAIRSGPGIWNSQQLFSQVQGSQSQPDTDGAIISYSAKFADLSGVLTDRIVWQPVDGGTEQVLSIPGSAIDPSLSAGLIAFAYEATGSGPHQIALYDTRSNFLYNLPSGTTSSVIGTTLNDISVTPDGKVRVVWQEFDTNANQWNVYAYVFNLPQGDFSFSTIAPLSIAAGASASTNVIVNSLNGFNSAVNLSVTGQPAGVTASLTPNFVTPPSGNSASSILNVSISPALTPTNFTLTITGTSGALTHTGTANITVTATTTSVGNLIGNLLSAGCIDNAGIANALTSKLSAAQSTGSVQAAINTLTALKNQINAQAGKHIATACNLGGVGFNPVTVLLLDVQALIDSLRVGMIADPITGYVVDANGVGVPGAAVSILDAGNIVATATTDITGFYFFATMSVLSPGSTYTVAVTGLPAGFVMAPPPSPPFMWSGAGMMIGTFVLN